MKTARRQVRKPGRIVTFYSYKGGSGRSMALANVAWALASNGRKVLAVDWDLEAPGLHRYFHPFLKDPLQQSTDGLIDRLWLYARAVATPAEDGDDDPLRLADCTDLVQRLDLPKGAKGRLDFIGSGRQDQTYSEKVGGFQWKAFYEDFGGGAFIDAFADWARKTYDIILLDSRTGVSDSAGVCTVHLPDILVLCLVYNRQSIEGVAGAAASIHRQRAAEKRPIRLLPCPMRVLDKSAAEPARRHLAGLMDDVLPGHFDFDVARLRAAEVIHYPWLAFEEKLAVFEDEPGETSSLLRDMHGLASRIVDNDLSLIPIDRAILNAYWRRAAFSDPRLAELERLRFEPPETAVWKLRAWVDETLLDEEIRPDWGGELAAGMVSTAIRLALPEASETSDQLCNDGVRLALSLIRQNPDQNAGKTGRTLNLATNYFKNLRRHNEALNSAVLGIEILSKVKTSESHWWLCRLFISAGDITYDMGRLPEASSWYRKALEYLTPFPRSLSHYTGMAMETLVRLVRLLIRMRHPEDALSTAHAYSDYVRAVGHRTKERAQPYYRFLSAQAEACLAAGRLDEGLSVTSEALDLIPEENSDWNSLKAEILAVRSRLLTQTGLQREAAEALEKAFGLLNIIEWAGELSSEPLVWLHTKYCVFLVRIGNYDTALREAELFFELLAADLPIEDQVRFLDELLSASSEMQANEHLQRLRNRLERKMLIAALKSDPDKPVHEVFETLKDAGVRYADVTTQSGKGNPPAPPEEDKHPPEHKPPGRA